MGTPLPAENFRPRGRTDLNVRAARLCWLRKLYFGHRVYSDNVAQPGKQFARGEGGRRRLVGVDEASPRGRWTVADSRRKYPSSSAHSASPSVGTTGADLESIRSSGDSPSKLLTKHYLIARADVQTPMVMICEGEQ